MMKGLKQYYKAQERQLIYAGSVSSDTGNYDNGQTDTGDWLCIADTARVDESNQRVNI